MYTRAKVYVSKSNYSAKVGEEMVRFCVGREEDGGEEGARPSSSQPWSKRQRTELQAVNLAPPTVEHLTDSDCEIEPENEEDNEDDSFEEQEEEEEEEEDSFEEVEVEEPELDDDPDSDGPVPVTLTDPDVLDCPICLDPLSIPVFQCDHGHVACSNCCPKIRMTCPSCSFPIGYNRCRAIEKVLESVKVACRHKRYGCKETIKYCDKHGHESTCLFAPCSCPLLVCNFASTAAKLYLHFFNRHPSSSTPFSFNKFFSVTLEKTQRVLFLRDELLRVYVINNFCESNETRVVNIVQIGPVNSSQLVYDLKATFEETSITLTSHIESFPNWSDCHPGKKALAVPSFYATSTGQIHLKICIRRNASSAAS